MTMQGLVDSITNKDQKPDICDDCALIAYDKGIGVVHEWKYDDLDVLEIKFETKHLSFAKDFISKIPFCFITKFA